VMLRDLLGRGRLGVHGLGVLRLSSSSDPLELLDSSLKTPTELPSRCDCRGWWGFACTGMPDAGVQVRFFCTGMPDAGAQVRFLCTGMSDAGIQVRFLCTGMPDAGVQVRFFCTHSWFTVVDDRMSMNLSSRGAPTLVVHQCLRVLSFLTC